MMDDGRTEMKGECIDRQAAGVSLTRTTKLRLAMNEFVSDHGDVERVEESEI